MKVHIVHLDSHDDYISTRDKLGWAKSPRVLIVWPKYGRILTRRLDLVLLQRFATEHSLQIGLVTRDADVLDNAEALAIPIFDSVDSVTDSGWRRRARQRPKSPAAQPKRKEITAPRTGSRKEIKQGTASTQHKILRALLLLLTFGILICLALIIISRAELIITPPTDTQSVEFILRVDPSLDSSIADGTIPGQLLTVRVADELRLPTSGEVAVPASSARGFVTFTNLTSNPLELEAGTGLRATDFDNKRFVTIEEVFLPGEIGAQVEAAIEATTPGPSGNLPTGAIDAVEGTLGLQVKVTNIVYLSGGENKIRAAVSENDFTRLEEELLNNLEDQALQQLSSRLLTDQTLLYKSIQLTQQHERNFDRELGQPADTLALYMDAEFSAYAFQIADAKAAAQNILVDQLPSGFSSVPSSFDFEIIHDNIQSHDGFVDIDAQVWQEIFMPIDTNMIRRIVRWQKPALAVALVSQRISLNEPPRLHLYPGWLPRLPFLLTQIEIRYSWQANQ